MLRIYVFLCINIIAAINVFLTAFCTFCLCPVTGKNIAIFPAGLFYENLAHNDIVASFSGLQTAILVLIGLCLLFIIINIIRVLCSFSKDSKIPKISTVSVIISTVWVVIYTALCFLFSPINALLGGLSYTSVSLFPLIVSIILAVVHFVLFGVISENNRENDVTLSPADRHVKDQHRKWRKELLLNHIELLAFSVVAAALSVVALLSNILTVIFKAPYKYIPTITLNGFDLVSGKTVLETKEERTFSFILFLFLLLTLVSLFIAVLSVCGRSSLASKLTLASVATSSVCCLLVGLFGQHDVLYLSAFDVDSFCRLQQLVLRGMIYSDTSRTHCAFCGGILQKNGDVYECEICDAEIKECICKKHGLPFYVSGIKHRSFVVNGEREKRRFLHDRVHEALLHFRNITPITEDGSPLCPHCKKQHNT